MKTFLSFFAALFFFSVSGQGQCLPDLVNPTTAVRIPPASFPYTTSGGVVVSVVGPTQIINGTGSSSCNNTFTSVYTPYPPNDPCWHIWGGGGVPQSITLNFSQPVTQISFAISSADNSETNNFTSNNGFCTLSNYCGGCFFASGGVLLRTSCAGGGFGAIGAKGTFVTVNNPAGATQYTVTNDMTSNGIRITLLDCVVPLPVLALDLLQFSGTCSENGVEINWEIASNAQSAAFAVERRDNRGTWEEIGITQSGNEANGSLKFTFVDERQPESVFYYRLRRSEDGGTVSYSEVLAVGNCYTNPLAAIVFPNPGTGLFNVMGSAGGVLTVFDVSGHPVLKNLTLEGPATTVDLSGFSAGVYLFEVMQNEKCSRIRVFRE